MRNLIKNAYRLPWVENDNPNGWIEPTTYCQLKCPGCYRGVDKSDYKPEHLDYNEVKRQIDWFVENRNVHTISIAGGEPLLYPQIDEIITYCTSINLRTMLYTNGVLIDKIRLEKLKLAGLTQVLVHVDRFQTRPDVEKGQTIKEKRNYFVNLFKEVGGIQLGFIQPLSAECFNELDDIVEFAGKNIDIVSLIIFTMYREVCWTNEMKKIINTDITLKQVVEHLQKTDNFVPASFLASEKNPNDPTWLFATKTGIPEINTGYFSSDFYKIAHERYRKAKGKFLFISRFNILKISSLIRFIFIRNNFKIIRSFIKNRNTTFEKYKHLYFQTFLLLRGPLKLENNKWDLCQNCPDRIIYKGKLVPSCILEDLKNKENHEFKDVTFEK
jgi:MoaA/NifB/PqqE/SkfB family radical SAM enzyme